MIFSDCYTCVVRNTMLHFFLAWVDHFLFNEVQDNQIDTKSPVVEESQNVSILTIQIILYTICATI